MRRLSGVDLRLLQIFATVVDCNGPSNAALALNIAPSTLSGHLAALEARLGSRLCDRGRGGFRLTTAGAETYRAATELFRSIEGFEAAMRRAHGRARRKLRIGLIDTVVSFEALGLAAAVAAFSAERPEVFLDLEGVPADGLARALVEGARDLVVGPMPQKPPGVAHLDLPAEEHRLYCGRGHPWFARDDAGLGPEDLRAARLSVRAYRYFDDTYRLGGVQPAASVATMEAQELLILSGAYVGYLPMHRAAAYEAQGLMRAVRPREWRLSSPFSAAWRVEGGAGDGAAFAAHLRAHLRALSARPGA